MLVVGQGRERNREVVGGKKGGRGTRREELGVRKNGARRRR